MIELSGIPSLRFSAIQWSVLRRNYRDGQTFLSERSNTASSGQGKSGWPERTGCRAEQALVTISRNLDIALGMQCRLRFVDEHNRIGIEIPIPQQGVENGNLLDAFGMSHR